MIEGGSGEEGMGHRKREKWLRQVERMGEKEGSCRRQESGEPEAWVCLVLEAQVGYRPSPGAEGREGGGGKAAEELVEGEKRKWIWGN